MILIRNNYKIRSENFKLICIIKDYYGSFTYSINNLSKINIYYLFIVPKPPQNLLNLHF